MPLEKFVVPAEHGQVLIGLLQLSNLATSLIISVDDLGDDSLSIHILETI